MKIQIIADITDKGFLQEMTGHRVAYGVLAKINRRYYIFHNLTKEAFRNMNRWNEVQLSQDDVGNEYRMDYVTDDNSPCFWHCVSIKLSKIEAFNLVVRG